MKETDLKKPTILRLDAGSNKNISMMTLCLLFAKIFVHLKHLIDDLFTDEVSRLLAVPVVPIEVPVAFSQFSTFSTEKSVGKNEGKFSNI